MSKDRKSGVDQITKLDTMPIQGGCNTVLETEQIPMGRFSMVQNFRDTHPGKKGRKGHRVLHTTADGTNSVMTLYQFNKTRISEQHTFAQMSDSDVLEATATPPTVTTGVFGTESFSGTTSPVPASWCTIKDAMLFSDGVDQHQIYYGDLSYVERFIHYKSDDVPPAIPEIGYDYSDEASDGLTTTVVVLDGMLVYESCVFICCPVRANGIKFTISAANSNAAYAELYYMKSTSAFTQLTYAANGWSDGTEVLTLDVAPATTWAAGDTIEGGSSSKTCLVVAKLTDLTYQVSSRTGAFTLGEILSNGTYTADQGAANPTITTLAATGTMAWATQPTDEIPSYMYGQAGYWYQLRVTATLDAEVELTAVQFAAPWQSIENIWDGVPVPVIETVFHVADVYKTFGATSIEIDSMASTDEVYLSSSDQICAIYVNVGGKPNTTGTTTVNAVYYWNGIAFASVGTISDGTSGLSQSGWITFPRAVSHKTQFNKNKYYAYWYYFTVDKTLNDDVIISLSTQPYFDIDKFGKGYCNTAWKGRAVYGTDRDQYIYVSALGRPQILNGQDFGPLEPGDGRSNLPVAMKPFHNELMVWQEEKGKPGGCLTLFEGLSPPTFGRLVLSNKIGTLNAKTVEVVDGVYTSTKTDEVVGMIAFFVSHYGVFMSDGRYVTGISDDIQNYFDPLKPECIRMGYENQMWLSHDTAYNVIRIGLVSGISVKTSTATSTTASKLVDTAGAFTTRKTVTDHPISHTIAIGDTVYNTTDETTALVTAIDSATALSLDTNIMASGEGYEIYSGTCNLFPVLDPVDKGWGFDLFQQNPSCMTEVQAGSGSVNTIQLVGGTKDGFVYQSNYGDNDVSTAINSYIDVELNADGKEVDLESLVLTAKTGTGVIITPTVDGVTGTAITETSLTRVRNKYSLNSKGMDLKVRIQNNTASESLHLFGIGMKIYSNSER